MFDVLVYLYENYWRTDACPEPQQLSRKLSAVGFEPDEIEDALLWLDGLSATAQSCSGSPVPGSMRIYTDMEQAVLGEQCIGFLIFIDSAGALPTRVREMAVDRAMAVGGGPLDLDDLKIIVLMVFWSLGEEPDALLLDELGFDDGTRSVH